MAEQEIKDSEVRAYKKHSVAIRWTHWINFPLITLMIMSGFMIYWANRVYTPFIPNEFYQKIHLAYKLAWGLGIHFFFMWLFCLNGLIYVAYLIWSKEWRLLLPNLASLKEAIQVTLYDFGLRKNLPAQGKFNAGQKIAYSSMIALAFAQILTGLAIYKPVQLQFLTSVFGGYETARLFHFIVTILFCLFFLVHIFQVARAGWNNFRSMITGTEEITEDEVQRAQGIKK